MTSAGETCKAVFDCMIFVQALLSANGPAAALLRLVETGEVTLFLSREALDELNDVLSRPNLRSRNPQINEVTQAAFLRRLERLAVMIRPVPQVFSYSRDPKDEKYINLAVACGAAYLVSRDTDLLDLMTGYTDECKEFRQRFRPLRVVQPLEFYQLVTEAAG